MCTATGCGKKKWKHVDQNRALTDAEIAKFIEDDLAFPEAPRACESGATGINSLEVEDNACTVIQQPKLEEIESNNVSASNHQRFLTDEEIKMFIDAMPQPKRHKLSRPPPVSHDEHSRGLDLTNTTVAPTPLTTTHPHPSQSHGTHTHACNFTLSNSTDHAPPDYISGIRPATTAAPVTQPTHPPLPTSNKRRRTSQFRLPTGRPPDFNG